MKSRKDQQTIIPFPKNRRLFTDIGSLAKSRHTIRGLVEIDVAKPRNIIRDHKENTGEILSFTAYRITCADRHEEIEILKQDAIFSRRNNNDKK